MSTLRNTTRRAGRGLATVLLALTTAATAMAQSVTIDFVSVGYAGNSADSNGRGSVSYEYQIGKYEVTNAQYAAFLNAVAKTDNFALYNTSMGASAQGGITRSGSSGSYSYTVKGGYENKPVTYVSYWDAARFANWAGTGYTEGRAVLNGPVLPGAAFGLNFSLTPTTVQGNRLAGAVVALPTQDEWYKAAYYQPATMGGPSDNYWLYPTKSDLIPTSAVPGSLANSANFYRDDGIVNGVNGGYAVTQSTSFSSTQVYLTDVGSYAASASFFGTFDQGGNVWEWNSTEVSAGLRGLRGGGWRDGEGLLRSSGGGILDPAGELNLYGFRVASAPLAPIPEPSTYAALVGLASLGVAMWRRRAGRGTLST